MGLLLRKKCAEGVMIWGARGLTKTSSSEWRYINVRRLFNMIEESIARSTRWIVLEPNDESLWKAIRRDINAFLSLIWRSGAPHTDFVDRISVTREGRRHELGELLSYDRQLAAELHAKDRCHTYGSFHIADLAA